MMKLLVIGSGGHDRADCFDWMQPFPNLEEYDAVILNLASIDQSLFDKMVVKGNSLRHLQPAILNLLSNGKNVYCLIAPYLFQTPPPDSGQAYVSAPPSNYDWMPVKPSLQPNNGQSIVAITEPEFVKYFKTVGRWEIEILGLLNPPSVLRGSLLDTLGAIVREAGIATAEPLTLTIRELCTNKAGKMIASKVMLPQTGSGGIYLLPPPTKTSAEEGIDLIIDLISGRKPENKPRWLATVEVPGVKELKTQVEAKQRDIEKIKNEVLETQRQISEMESYAGLISGEGEELVDIVRKVLAELGINAKKTAPGYPVDLIDVGNVAIEVTGTSDKINSDTDKIFQLMRFKDNYGHKEKLILIANTHRRLPPDKRRGRLDFTNEVSDHLKLKKVSAFTAVTLFEIWKSFKIGKLDSKTARAMILKTEGVLKFP